MENICKKILQIITIYNAISRGWSVKKISSDVFELTKQEENEDTNIGEFIDAISNVL